MYLRSSHESDPLVVLLGLETDITEGLGSRLWTTVLKGIFIGFPTWGFELGLNQLLVFYLVRAELLCHRKWLNTTLARRVSSYLSLRYGSVIDADEKRNS